jgi:deoxycytidylate deaminase
MNPIGTNTAIRVAKTADHKFRVGSAILKGRRVISTGTNKGYTSPYIRLNIDRYSMVDKNHAEISAILNARDRDLTGATIYIARCLKDDGTALSRPCDLCMEMIIEAGIRKIVYTTGDSSVWEIEKV